MEEGGLFFCASWWNRMVLYYSSPLYISTTLLIFTIYPCWKKEYLPWLLLLCVWNLFIKSCVNKRYRGHDTDYNLHLKEREPTSIQFWKTMQHTNFPFDHDAEINFRRERKLIFFLRVFVKTCWEEIFSSAEERRRVFSHDSMRTSARMSIGELLYCCFKKIWSAPLHVWNLFSQL